MVQFIYISRRATTTKTRTRNATNTTSLCSRNESDYKYTDPRVD